MVGQITGKMFDHPIKKDCVSDLSDPGSCRIGPVRQVAGPENAAIQNLAALHLNYIDIVNRNSSNVKNNLNASITTSTKTANITLLEREGLKKNMEIMGVFV